MGDEDTGNPGRPLSSALQVPGELGIFFQEHDSLGEIPTDFFLQNVPQLHQQRWVYSLALWKIINEEDAKICWKSSRLDFLDEDDTKKLRRELFQRNFALGIFWGGAG